jgi:hypothetical protein
MGDYDLDEIFGFNQQVWDVLSPLTPVLFYLDQDNTEEALRRLYTFRGEEWMH